MRRTLKRLILPLLLVLLATAGLNAQPYDLNAPVPLDKSVRYGKLPNGMTYYIEKNTIPAKRAEFHIFHKAGGILENDSQDGLAHFLEHMAFNGTTHFPHETMLRYAESIGLKFGANINASTGTDVTNYLLTDVPMIREGIIDSCLLILHDWSGSITCDQDEIDAERGVIREEWRTRRDAGNRARFALMPYMFKGSMYGERTVIGSLDVINNFKRNEILDFYHKWYRPDLQGVAIVGDFDVDMMEAKVKKIMGDIPAAVNPATKPTFTIPDNKEPIVGIYTDPEITSTRFSVYFKHNDTRPENKNIGYYRTSIVRGVINMMTQSRFSELMQKENLPMSGLSARYGGYMGDKDAYTCGVGAKPGKEKESYQTLITELERIHRYGFVPSELDRIKIKMKRGIESAYAERDKQQTSSIASAIRDNFLEGEPMPGSEFDYKFANYVLDGLTIDEVNKVAKSFMTDNNVVITVVASEKDKAALPTEAELTSILTQVKSAKIDAYVDNTSNQPLMSKMPKAGKVVKTKAVTQFGATEWTLSNGIKVVIKPTDFKQDEIGMSAFSNGGLSLVSDTNLPSAKQLGGMVNGMGVANFSPIELSKVLTGKLANVSFGLSSRAQTVNGGCSPADLETMLQLVYLKFTQPRFDQSVFNNAIERQRIALKAQGDNPQAAFKDTMALAYNSYHKRALPWTMDMLDQVSLQKVEAVYRDRFANPASFTFVFTGNIDLKTAKPLVEKYLASLPSTGRKETWKDEGIRSPKGKVTKDFKRPLAVEKVTLVVDIHGDMPFSQKNSVTMGVLSDALQMRYTKSIREEKGGAYSIGVQGQLSREPIPTYDIYVSFDTNPTLADEMIQIVYAELKKIANEGPLASDIAKIKEFKLKSYEQSLKENSYWQNLIQSYYRTGKDYNSGFDKVLNALTAADVQQMAKQIVATGDELEVIMRPQTK